MRALIAATMLIVAMVVLPTRALAEAEPEILAARASDAVAALQDRRPAEDVFTDEFLKAVPPAQIARLAAELQAANGKIMGFDELKPIAPTAARFLIRFEKATAEASIQLDSGEPH